MGKEVAYPSMRPMVTARPAEACQWLHGEPKDRDFCGDPIRAGSPYCPEHHERCYRDYDVVAVRKDAA